MKNWRWLLAAMLLAIACDESIAPAPRVTPARESLWMLVQLQLELDQLKPVLVSLEGKSFSPGRIEKLTSEVVVTTEYLASSRIDDDGLRAARYRVDLIGVAYDLLRTMRSCRPGDSVEWCGHPVPRGWLSSTRPRPTWQRTAVADRITS